MGFLDAVKGIKDKIEADLRASLDAMTAKAASFSKESVPAIPKVPAPSGIDLKVPSFNDILSKLPPIPGPPAGMTFPALPELPALPPLPAIPQLPNIKDLMSNLPIDVTKLAGSIPSIPAIPGLPGIPGVPAVPGIPAIPTSFADLMALAPKPELPAIPAIPPLPAMPPIPVPSLPPVETPTINATMPDPTTGKNQMEEKGVNLKAQIAIVGEQERQRIVKDILIPGYEGDILSRIDGAKSAINAYGEFVKTYLDKENHPSDEAGWKTVLESEAFQRNDIYSRNAYIRYAILALNTNFYDPSDPWVEGSDRDFWTGYKVSPILESAFKAHKTAYIDFKEVNDEEGYTKIFSPATKYFDPLPKELGSVFSGPSYAVWKTYGEKLDITKQFSYLTKMYAQKNEIFLKKLNYTVVSTTPFIALDLLTFRVHNILTDLRASLPV